MNWQSWAAYKTRPVPVTFNQPSWKRIIITFNLSVQKISTKFKWNNNVTSHKADCFVNLRPIYYGIQLSRQLKKTPGDNEMLKTCVISTNLFLLADRREHEIDEAALRRYNKWSSSESVSNVPSFHVAIAVSSCFCVEKREGWAGKYYSCIWLWLPFVIMRNFWFC